MRITKLRCVLNFSLLVIVYDTFECGRVDGWMDGWARIEIIASSDYFELSLGVSSAIQHSKLEGIRELRPRYSSTGLRTNFSIKLSIRETRPNLPEEA